jgi:hypothetical protein
VGEAHNGLVGDDHGLEKSCLFDRGAAVKAQALQFFLRPGDELVEAAVEHLGVIDDNQALAQAQTPTDAGRAVPASLVLFLPGREENA